MPRKAKPKGKSITKRAKSPARIKYRRVSEKDWQAIRDAMSGIRKFADAGNLDNVTADYALGAICVVAEAVNTTYFKD